MQRKQTTAFVAVDPRAVVLTRYAANGDGARGKVRTAQALDPQTMRVLPSGYKTQERITVEGKSVTPTHVLVGLWDSDILRGDTYFDPDGKTYEIVYVHVLPYEKKGEAVARG